MARPEFKPTNKQRQDVMLGRYAGMAVCDVAVGIGIDEKTLRKHFVRELLYGPQIVRRQLLAVVTEQALEGKRSAITLLERMTRDPPPRRRQPRRKDSREGAS